VADSFLRRWFGGKAAPPSVEEARAELDRVLAERPAFETPLRWLRELLPDLVPIPDPPAVAELTPDRARAKLAGGVPLLRGEYLALDVKAFRKRWQRACAALGQPGKPLAGALRRGKLEPADMTAAVLAGQPETVRDRAEAIGLDAALAAAVLRYVLFPVFTSLEAALAPMRQGAGWEHGSCPTCGSWPLLGEYRGLDQSRYLRCGLCAAGWEVPRLWCPFCGNRDHERLQLLHAEGEETKYKAALCDACRGCVKMVTTLSALPPLPLLVADAATLHLELAATERGYTTQP